MTDCDLWRVGGTEGPRAANAAPLNRIDPGRPPFSRQDPNHKVRRVFRAFRSILRLSREMVGGTGIEPVALHVKEVLSR